MFSKYERLLHSLPTSLEQAPVFDIPNRLLYQDDHLLVMNKPPHLPSTGNQLDDPDSFHYWVMTWQKKYVWSIHQLDADTTGLLLFTYHKKKVHLLNQLLSHSHTTKRYLAIVNGHPPWSCIECDEKIGQRSDGSWGVSSTGKESLSSFRVISYGEQSTLLEISIKTGRTHQIRIHLNFLGYPLLGEEWYIDTPCNRHPHQALHFSRFQFPSSLPPSLVSLSELVLNAPVPPSFKNTMLNLKFPIDSIPQ